MGARLARHDARARDLRAAAQAEAVEALARLPQRLLLLLLRGCGNFFATLAASSR